MILPAGRACAGLFQFAFVGNSQLFTAFGAAAGQNFTAVSGLHAFAETVNGFTAAAMRLKCTFHYNQFFCVLQCPVEKTGWFHAATGHHTRSL